MDILTTFELLGATSATGLAYLGLQSAGLGVGYWRLKDPEARRSHRDAAKIRRTWRRLARHTGLYLKDDVVTTAQALLSSDTRRPQPKIRTPKLIDLEIDPYGMTIDFRPVPSVGRDEFERQLPHLANFWGMVRASVDQPDPRVIRVRAVRTDPLERKLVLGRPTRVPAELNFVPIGVDEYGEMVPLHLAHSTGVGIYGAPRWGKTSLILGLLTAMAEHEEFQIVLADGKVTTGFEGDYADIAHRCVAVIGDSIEQYNQLIKELHALRISRQTRIRGELGAPNIWDVGPSREWPLVIVVIDEAHSYFRQIKPDGGDPALKKSNALAAENAWLTEDVVKKCGSVGIYFVIATQKPTTDAIPSAIRDNLTDGVCLGVRTEAVAVAALGESIKNHPEASPLQFMKHKYKGCAVIGGEEGPGFTRFRNPFCSPALATQIASRTRHLAAGRETVPLTIGQAHREIAPATPAALLEKAQDEN